MKILLLLIIITCYQITVNAQRCSNPNIQKRQIFIYRTVPLIKIKVVECLYTDSSQTNNYYEITERCLKAAETNVFYDKYDDVRYAGNDDSKMHISQYEAEADPLVNKIWLKSGTSCRYDVGFCYDPKEAENYAVAWSVDRKPQETCPQNLNKIQQIFYGNVDFWEFPVEQKTYIFYYVPLQDKGIALGLSNTSTCHDKKVWQTEKTGFIVSVKSLLPSTSHTPQLDEKMFPSLKSIAAVSDFILKDCSLKARKLVFDSGKDVDYLLELENLKTILKINLQNVDNNKFKNDQHDIAQRRKRDILGIEDVESLLKIINEHSDELLQQKDDQLELLSKTNHFLSDVKALGDKIKMLQGKDKQLDNKLQAEIRKAIPTIKQTIINELKYLITSVNQSSISCDKDVKKFKSDIDRTNNDIRTKMNTIPKTIETNVKKQCSKIENDIKRTLKPSVDTAIHKSEDCLKKLSNLQNTLDKRVNTLETKLQTCTLEQKYTNNDFKRFNNTLQLRLAACEGDIKNLSGLINSNKDTTQTFIDTKIGDIIKNVSETYKTINTNLDLNIKNKLKPVLQSLNNKVNKCSKDVNKIRADTNDRVDNFRQEISTRDTDISKKLDTLNKTIRDKIDATDSKLTDLNKKVDSDDNRSKYDIDKTINDLDTKINTLSSTLDQTVEKQVKQQCSNIEGDIKRVLTPSVDTAVQKSEDCLNKLSLLQNYTDTIETEVQSCVLDQKSTKDDLDTLENTLQLRLDASENRIKHLHGLINSSISTTQFITNTTIDDITKNVSDACQIMNTNLERTVTDKLQREIKSFNNKINQYSTLVDNLRTDTNNNVDYFRQEISKRNADASKEVNNLNRLFMDKIDAANSKLEDLNKKVDENKIHSDDNQNVANAEFDRITQDISSIKKGIATNENRTKYALDSAKNTEIISKDLERVKKLFFDESRTSNIKITNLERDAEHSAKNTEIISKDLERVKKLFFDESGTSNIKITNLERDVEHLIQLSKTEDNDNKGKITQPKIIENLENKLNTIESSVYSLQSTMMGQDTNKLHSALNQCTQEVQQLKRELGELKTEYQNITNTIEKMLVEQETIKLQIYDLATTTV